MRVAGGISLIFAVLFFVAFIAMLAQVAHLNHQIGGFSGWEKAANDWTGISRHNEGLVDSSKILAGVFFLGMVMTGVLGVVLIGSQRR
jgi:hypothetical protein